MRLRGGETGSELDRAAEGLDRLLAPARKRESASERLVHVGIRGREAGGPPQLDESALGLSFDEQELSEVVGRESVARRLRGEPFEKRPRFQALPRLA